MEQLGKTVYNEDDIEIIVKKLDDGSTAFGLFNRNSIPRVITADWNLLGLKGKQKLRDVWRQKDIGVYRNSFSANVRSHGVVLIKATQE